MRFLEHQDEEDVPGREGAERSLGAFMKQAWHGLNPLTPFVDGVAAAN